MLHTQRVYYREPCGFQEKNNAVILRSLYDSEASCSLSICYFPSFCANSAHLTVLLHTSVCVSPARMSVCSVLAFKDKLQPTWDWGGNNHHFGYC